MCALDNFFKGLIYSIKILEISTVSSFCVRLRMEYPIHTYRDIHIM